MAVPRERAERLTRLGRDQRATTAERDREIRAAREDGGSIREIARLVGMSPGGVQRVLGRAEAPPPRPGVAAGEAGAQD